MKFDRLTFFVAISVLAVIIVYDTWTLIARGYETTISSQLYTLALGQPIIPCAIGVVIGHLFWGNRAAREMASTVKKKLIK